MKTLLILIFIIFSFNLISKDYIEKEIVKQISTSLIINLFENNYISKNGVYFSSILLYPTLDSNCNFVVNIQKLNKQINYLDRPLQLYSYTFDFEYECYEYLPYEIKFDDKTREVLIISPEEPSIYTHPIVQDTLVDDHKHLLNLHKNGLVAIDTSSDYIHYLSGTTYYQNYVADDLIDTLTKTEVTELIKLKYFNYSPKEIDVSIAYNKFSFYSETINRFINGEIKKFSINKYYLKLNNGILFEYEQN
jgi:hypothetical protein